MKLEKQCAFIKWLSRLIDQGYSLEESLEHLSFIEPQMTKRIQRALERGIAFNEAIRYLRFKSYAYHLLTIAIETNTFDRGLKLLLKRYDFELKQRKHFRELLYYPLTLFLFAVILFEYFRVELYPMLLRLSLDVTLSPLHTFLAFHLLKLVLALLVIGYIVFRRFPRTFHLIPLVRELRTLSFCHQLNVLLQSGHSMEEALDLFEKQNAALRKDIQRLKECIVQNCLINHPYFRFTQRFIHVLLLGLRTNQLTEQLSVYERLAEERCELELKRIGQWLQYGMFLLIAFNILMVYYVLVFPIINMFYQI